MTTTYTIVESVLATGCTNSHSVLVTALPLPTPGITGSATVCESSTDVTYTTEALMTGYTWTVSTGGVITSGAITNTIKVTWNTAGAQTVSVIYTNAMGCNAAAASVMNVTVNPLTGIAGAITGTTVICAGVQDVGYSVTAIANAVSYQWTLPSGATITSGKGTRAITVSFASNAASGNIVVYGSSNCGNGTPSMLAFIVTPKPDVAGSISGPGTFGKGTTGANYWVQSG